MATSTCWVVAETDTQSNIFDSSVLKKLCLIINANGRWDDQQYRAKIFGYNVLPVCVGVEELSVG
jgi:hypothetical protein